MNTAAKNQIPPGKADLENAIQHRYIDVGSLLNQKVQRLNGFRELSLVTPGFNVQTVCTNSSPAKMSECEKGEFSLPGHVKPSGNAQLTENDSAIQKMHLFCSL